ncbi:MAG: lipoyl(octanoyl) transferase LipB [Burkholderiaceae bacterium]
MSAPILIRPLQPADYLPTLEAMRRFTASRGPDDADEIWLVEHPPVFTMGLAARPEHVLAPGDIPVLRTERGGQVTYHGPGQVVAYLMIDLRRRGLMVRDFVCRIEQAAIELLAGYGVAATRRSGAPGVYLAAAAGTGGDGAAAAGVAANVTAAAGAKIVSIGIKVSRGCSYHGVALNTAMDLEPFQRIDPCGYPGQAVTDLRQCIGKVDVAQVAARFGHCLSVQIESPARGG